MNMLDFDDALRVRSRTGSFPETETRFDLEVLEEALFLDGCSVAGCNGLGFASVGIFIFSNSDFLICPFCSLKN